MKEFKALEQGKAGADHFSPRTALTAAGSLVFWAGRFTEPNGIFTIPNAIGDADLEASEQAPIYCHIDNFFNSNRRTCLDNGLNEEQIAAVQELVKNEVYAGKFGKRIRVVTIGAMAAIHAATGELPTADNMVQVLITAISVLKVDDLLDRRIGPSVGELQEKRALDVLHVDQSQDIREIGLLDKVILAVIQQRNKRNSNFDLEAEYASFVSTSYGAMVNSQNILDRLGDSGYSFKDAFDFRMLTNDQFFKVLMLAGGAYSMTQAQFDEYFKIGSFMSLLIQGADDIEDMSEDSGTQLNLFKGLMNDIRRVTSKKASSVQET